MTLVHRERLRVALSDTDASGRIHFTAALRYAEHAEHGLLRAVGAPAVASFPRRHVEADYRLPLAFGDEITVEIWVSKLGRTSIRYPWRILLDGEPCVAGELAVVHVGEEGGSLPLDPELRAGLSRYLSP